MKSLPGTICRNRQYFFGYLVFLLALMLFCIATGKDAGFLLINSFHNPLLDYFFILLTNVGNGLFVIAIIAWMVIRKKYYWAWQTGISFLFTGLLVQILKHLIYSPRPKTFFEHRAFIHTIQGITRTGASSFPSGHTTSVFALCTLLSLFFSDKRWSIFFLMIACLTGFSRIYLSQHFPIDVLAGSLIGVLGSLFIYTALPDRLLRKDSPRELSVQPVNSVNSLS